MVIIITRMFFFELKKKTIYPKGKLKVFFLYVVINNIIN